MKKVNFIIILAMLLSSTPFISYSQDSFPFVAKTKNEFTKPKHDPKIEDVYINGVYDVVVKANTGKTKYGIDDVWGFRDKKGKSFRIYKGKDYEVLQTDALCVYSRNEQDAMPYNKTNIGMGHETYFFSIGIGGKLYEMTGANFKKVFSKSNPKFLTLIKEQSVFESYSKYDKGSNSFKIVELYKQSLH
jgi:hypothetical protein